MAGDQAQRAWIERVLGYTFPPLPDPKILAARAAAASERVKKLAEPGALVEDLRGAINALKQNDLADAADRLDTLEARLTSAERAATARMEIARSSEGLTLGVVAMAKVRLRFEALLSSREIAAARLGELISEVLETEFEDDPRQQQGEAEVARIDSRVPAPDTALRGALDDLISATDATRRGTARTAAKKAISEYRELLLKATMLTELQETEYGSVRIFDEINDSLSALDAALAG